MEDKVKKLEEKFFKNLEEELSYVTDDIKTLADEDPDDLPKVYEDDFIKYLLPFLLNLVDKNDTDDAVVFKHNWINLTGDLIKPFNVVDHSGNILFKVPKYLANYDQDNTPINKVSYITILKEFKNEYERTPNLAEVNLDKTMKSISSMVSIDNEAIKEYLRFYYMLKDKYENYYNNYNINKYNTILNGVNNEINKLEDRLQAMYPDDVDYNDMVLELEELKIEKEKYTNLIKQLNGTVEDSIPIENKNEDEIDYSSAFDYSDVDYED